MDIKKPAEAESKNPETTNPNSDPSGQKSRNDKKTGRSKKAVTPDERIAMTFSFTPVFAKKLKGLVGWLDESASEFVESRLSGPVQRELKKILEEVGQ